MSTLLRVVFRLATWLLGGLVFSGIAAWVALLLIGGSWYMAAAIGGFALICCAAEWRLIAEKIDDLVWWRRFGRD